MIRIIDGRASGKTSRLMLLAKQNQGTIVCSNPYAMNEKAHSYGFTGINFISYEDFLQSNYEKGTTIFIDEIEMFAKFIDSNLSGYTLSNED